jgi:hypothetical protein
MHSNAEYVNIMNTQLKTWDAEAAALVAEADRVNTLSRAAQDLWMKELRASRDSAHKVFREISAANETAAMEMHSSMEAAWGLMQSTLRTIASQVKH